MQWYSKTLCALSNLTPPLSTSLAELSWYVRSNRVCGYDNHHFVICSNPLQQTYDNVKQFLDQ